MKILALEHELPSATSESFQRYAKEEARTAWELHQSGAIRELYFRADGLGTAPGKHAAVLVLECDSTEAAERVLASLPFVREGLITFELIPLVAYPGFARLFTED